MSAHALPIALALTLPFSTAHAQELLHHHAALGQEAVPCGGLPCDDQDSTDWTEVPELDRRYLERTTAEVYSMTTFSMTEPHGYDALPAVNGLWRWGQHALAWKQRHSQAMHPTHTIALSPPSQAPTTMVLPGDEADLNDLEATQYTRDGAPWDPDGIWTQVDLVDPREALLYAALGMYWWGTPAYVHYVEWNNGVVMARVAAITSVTLTVPGPVPVEQLCGWTAASQADQLSGAQACAANQLIDVSDITLTVWVTNQGGPTCPASGCLVEGSSPTLPAFAGHWQTSAVQGHNFITSDPPGPAQARVARELAATMAEALFMPHEEGVER